MKLSVGYGKILCTSIIQSRSIKVEAVGQEKFCKLTAAKTFSYILAQFLHCVFLRFWCTWHKNEIYLHTTV